MELLGIGPLELIVILILALVVFSPKDIAGGGKAVGRWINRLYRSDTYKSMKQVSQELQDLPNRLAREANLDELKDLEKEVKSVGETLRLDVPPNPPLPPAENRSEEASAAAKPDLQPAEPPAKTDPENTKL
jgi:sec-independent protein translocase protein TatB